MINLDRTTATRRAPIDSLRKTALIAGVIYLITKESLTVGGPATGTHSGATLDHMRNVVWHRGSEIGLRMRAPRLKGLGGALGTRQEAGLNDGLISLVSREAAAAAASLLVAITSSAKRISPHLARSDGGSTGWAACLTHSCRATGTSRWRFSASRPTPHP
jgi:hypothetical protein